MALLYDTGARIQETLDLKPSHFRLQSPAFVRLFGKGRRERICPLLPQTAQILAQFLNQQRKEGDNSRVFQNRYGKPLSSHGARYIFRKYVTRAAETMPGLCRLQVTPHILRHTKAMHLLQSGVPLVTIKEILGHADVSSTEIYATANTEMKRKALESVGSPSETQRKKRKMKPDLLAWLESL